MKWAFHPLALFTACLLILSSLALVAVRFDEFYAKLPTFHQFFAAENWVYLALVVAGTKVLHELGHALVCRHFGGKCHEMGVMLMMFAPCLYCNVSDAWMFPSRWRRAAVGAGGMAVELMLAALASFVWWFSAPGIINSLALQVMFVCSVSTLLINANPLLRFDGYYILADLIDIPNLRQKAEGLLRKTLGQWLLGLEAPPDPMLPQTRRGFLIGFAIAAATYRWIVTFSIFWFLYRVLEPYGLKLFGQLLAIMAVSSLLITPLVRMIKFFLVPGRTDKVNRLRAAISLGITLAALAGIALIPLPYYVECAVEIEPYHARSVYVDVAGTLDSLHVKPGQQVTANQALADLSDIDQRLALAKLEGERSELAARLAWLRQREITDDEAGMEVGNVQESLTAVEQQLDKRKQYVKRLNVVAPVSGYVLPPQAVDAPADDKVKLAVWWGTPLETRNIGAHLQEGVLLCRIGDPRQLQAVVAVDQSDIDFVRPGQTVSIKLDQFPGRVYRGTIDQISKSDVQATSAGMSSQHGGRLATKTDAQGRAKPLSTTYSADVPLGLDDEGVLTIGARGRAKIHAGYRTLGSRLWRTLAQTFNFRL